MGLNTQPDRLDTLIGIYLGLGLTVDEAATRIDRDEATVFRRKSDIKRGPWIEEIRAATASAAQVTVEKRIKEIESKTDIKQRLSQKAYARLETLLLRDEDDGLTLGALKEALDRTEGKALDRKAILTRNEEIVRHEISDETLNRITGFMNRHQALLPAAQEAIIVELDAAN